MRWTVALVAIALTGLAAPAARGAPLPSGPGTLLPSLFQGGDGDQADAPGLVDWQGLQAAGRVAHNPDAGQEFAGGSEENDPVEWDLVPGQVARVEAPRRPR
ncbi:MAG TPA: hypothetical protein VGF32_10145 [Streptosporangiaceae bacterium]